ncbi:MAG: YlaC family protein [Arsenophonus sp.]|nr:YlaC family protein [Arsenophonus sp.]MDR5615794.1 YlaC family protein [Arsenophonus sp.]
MYRNGHDLLANSDSNLSYLVLWFVLDNRFYTFFLLLAAALLFDIKPTYRFKDIGILDLRVCYNGEWFVTEKVSDTAINKILAEPTINNAIKTELKRLIKQKNKITFYDIYLLAYPPNSIKNRS